MANKKISELGAVAQVSAAMEFPVAVSGGTRKVNASAVGSFVYPQINVAAFGAVGDGSTDDASNINTALRAASAAGGGQVFFPSGTFVIGSTLNIPSYTKVLINPGTTIKLAASAETIMLANSNTSAGNTGITITGGGTIDGNKDQQTNNTEGTGIKLLKCDNFIIDDLYIKNTEGHGVHVNDSGANSRGGRLSNLYIDSPGSQAGNTFGSGVAITSGASITINNVVVVDGAKAGFRLSGSGITMTGCISRGCNEGGVTPVASELTEFVCVGGEFSYSGTNDGNVNGDGMRLVDVKRATITGVNCHHNDGSGILLLNGSNHVTITGGVLFNNGQNSTARDATSGRDGITIKNDASACSDISIIGCHVFDNQGTATQDYGIAVEDSSDAVVVDGCFFENNQTNPTLNSTSGTDVLFKSGNRGLPWDESDHSGITISATAGETLAKTVTIHENGLPLNGGVRVIAGGTISGTNGTKDIKVKFGSNSRTVISVSATGTDTWRIDSRLAWVNNSTIRASHFGSYGSSLTRTHMDTWTATRASANDLSLAIEPGNSSDSVVVRYFTIQSDPG